MHEATFAIPFVTFEDWILVDGVVAIGWLNATHDEVSDDIEARLERHIASILVSEVTNHNLRKSPSMIRHRTKYVLGSDETGRWRELLGSRMADALLLKQRGYGFGVIAFTQAHMALARVPLGLEFVGVG